MADLPALIPGYFGPSPACRTGFTGGVHWGIDVYCNAAARMIEMIIWERNLDNSYSYIGQNRGKGLVWQRMIAQHPLYNETQNFDPPGAAFPAITGSMWAVVNVEGEMGMVGAWLDYCAGVINERILTGGVVDPRTPEEVAAQQKVAFGIYHCVVKETYPVTITLPAPAA